MNNPTKLKQRALVTGATGYIGSHLVKRLVAQGWDVHIIVRSNLDKRLLAPVISQISCHLHDATTAGMIQLVGDVRPDVVFHLASLFLVEHTSHDIEAMFNCNILFATQLLEAMAVNDIRHLINTSTAWQHYQNEVYNPVNLYAATKQAFECMLDYYVSAHGLVVTTLALFDTYGPNDPRAKLITLLWNAAMEQKELSMSPGQQLIDLVHVDDVIEAYMIVTRHLCERESGHLRYGVSSGKRVSLRELVKQFELATGLHVQIHWGGRAYRKREIMVPWSNFSPVPNWSPRISFKTGITEARPEEHQLPQTL